MEKASVWLNEMDDRNLSCISVDKAKVHAGYIWFKISQDSIVQSPFSCIQDCQ